VVKITRKAGKIEALKQAVKTLDGSEGRVGWFSSAVYEGGQPVAGVAYVQEYGSTKRGIPPRPFMRSTVTEKQGEWAKTMGELTRAAANGKIDPKNITELLAMSAGGHVRATITKLADPPLKQGTIDARKRRLANGGARAKASIAKPLVDTGIMLNTLSCEVAGKITPVKEN
jgi:hypothetical protein